jgi:hypothetical protein
VGQNGGSGWARRTATVRSFGAPPKRLL